MRSILVLYISIFTASAALESPKSYDKASIGILLDLHVPGGQLNLNAVQHLVAAKWATEVINNQSAPQGIKMDTQVFDTCGIRDIAMRDVFFAVKNALEPRGKLPLLGLIGLGEPEIVGDTVSTLHAFNIPLILASPKLSDSVLQQGNILTTAPDMSSVVAPVLAVAKELGVKRISLISYCPHSILKFQRTVSEMGIDYHKLLRVSKQSKTTGDHVKKFIEESEINETIALILDPEQIYELAQYLRGYKLQNNILLTGTIGLDKNRLKLGKNVFVGGYLIEPHMPELPDFRDYFLNQLETAGSHNDTLTQQFMERIHNCKWKWNSSPLSPKRECESVTKSEISEMLQIPPEVTFIVKAVSAFSAAVFLVQVEQCQGHNLTECTRISNVNLQQEILQTLSRLSFASQKKAPFEIQGTNIHVTHDGQLISNKYMIFKVRDNGDVSGIGWYSDEHGLVLDHALQDAQMVSSNLHQEKTTVRGTHLGEADSGVNAKRVTPEPVISGVWATVMVAATAVGTCLTLFMMLYVLIKMCDGTLTGNQSLGLVLLFSIMTLYVSTVLFIIPINEVCCTLRAFVYPVAMCVCYGVLIVKVMQLRSLVLLGLGGRVSYINQYMFLFFIVLVQVVINVQWYLTNRPQFRVDKYGFPYCYMPTTDFLLLHLYITILVIIDFLYGVSVLKIKRNYKEGHWVTLAAFLTMPVLVAWGVARSFAPEKYDDPTTCMALITLATVLILVLFIPKMKTIAKQSSHFKHKKMHVSDSATTIFTTFTDPHNSSVSAARKKVIPATHGASMLDAYPDNVMYEVTTGPYH